MPWAAGFTGPTRRLINSFLDNLNPRPDRLGAFLFLCPGAFGPGAFCFAAKINALGASVAGFCGLCHI